MPVGLTVQEPVPVALAVTVLEKLPVPDTEEVPLALAPKERALLGEADTEEVRLPVAVPEGVPDRLMLAVAEGEELREGLGLPEALGVSVALPVAEPVGEELSELLWLGVGAWLGVTEALSPCDREPVGEPDGEAVVQLLLDREGEAVALELGVALPVPVWLPVGLLLAGREADQLGLWLPEPEPLGVMEAEEP